MAADSREPFELERLLPAAVSAALRTQRWPDFLEWMHAAIPAFSSPDIQAGGRPGLQRALALALARGIWNVLPLPRNGFAPEPFPEPGRNDPCPCGSGEKYKRCCAGAPPLPALQPALIWFHVLDALKPAERATALASRHLPRASLAEFADDQLQSGAAHAVVELLSPQFEPEVRHRDEIAGRMMYTLCDAYDAMRGGKGRKRRLLERIASLPARSQLRSDAWQRLACIRMDEGQRAKAREAFKHAQQDSPGDPSLGMLEVQLLLGENKPDLARERARFHRAQLRRREAEVDPGLLEFYDGLASDPGRAMSAVAMRAEGGAGQTLAEWIDRQGERPLPRYTLTAASLPTEPADIAAALRDRLRQMGVRGGALDTAVKDMERQLAAMPATPTGDTPGTSLHDRSEMLQSPPLLHGLESQWHDAFTLDKPFSVHPLPVEPGDIWQPDAERRWCDFLRAHPEAFDSLDILDDLATAVLLHPQGDQVWLGERLALPLLERSVAILDASLAGSTDAELHWAITAHRPVLRSLLRLSELEAARGNDKRAMRLDEQLLRLNPPDNHAARFRLAVDYLNQGDAAACLKLASRYSDDPAPELRFNEALAHFLLGHTRSAGEALQRAHEHVPRVARYLLPGRVRKPRLDAHGMSLDGDDRAWLYRDAMRSAWKQTPGALDWAKKVLGPGALRG